MINDVLVGFDYFSVEDATFAVDHMDVDFDEQAVLYAKQNSSEEDCIEFGALKRQKALSQKWQCFCT